MFLGKFSCIKSCTSPETPGSEDDETSPQQGDISKITNAAPATSKWNRDSPDKLSKKSKDSIIIGTVGPIHTKESSPDKIPAHSSKHDIPKSSISPPKPHADFEQLNEEMKQMNKELHELIEKRQEENENIKKTLGYFQNQVEGIRASPGIANIIQQRVGIPYLREYFQTIGENDYKTLFWKIGATCLIIHLCVSDICARVIPRIPWVFDFIFSVLVYSHFFLTSGMIWLNRNSQSVPSDIINNYQMFSHQIGAVLCGGAIIFLKLRQCSEKWLSITIHGQLALTICSYFIELWAPEHLDYFSHKILLFMQIVNIVLRQI